MNYSTNLDNINHVERRIQEVLIPISPDPTFVRKLNQHLHQPSLLPKTYPPGSTAYVVFTLLGVLAGIFFLVILIMRMWRHLRFPGKSA
jgi:hypothetical protein